MSPNSSVSIYSHGNLGPEALNALFHQPHPLGVRRGLQASVNTLIAFQAPPLQGRLVDEDLEFRASLLSIYQVFVDQLWQVIAIQRIYAFTSCKTCFQGSTSFHFMVKSKTAC